MQTEYHVDVLDKNGKSLKYSRHHTRKDTMLAITWALERDTTGYIIVDVDAASQPVTGKEVPA